MKKILYILFTILACLFFTGLVRADGPSYDIRSYRGTLILDTWDDATYEEELVYHFDDDYNGQYVTLGTAGNMPQGFEILTPPEVHVANRTLKREPEVQNLGNGYRVKIYNSGKAGDTVTVKVIWKLKNLLYIHQDILLLNWKPISDGDQNVAKVELKIVPKFASAKARSELNVHTAYMRPEAEIKKDQASYTATLSNLKSKEAVEIYAYWLKADLISKGESPRNTGLMREEEYHQTEKNIVQMRKWIKLLWKVILPGIILLFLLLANHFRRKFNKLTWSGVTYPTDTRLYEVPGDLAPLVMASIVYSVELDEVCPTSKADISQTFSFEKLVQATLLDLIDRGAITYEQNGSQTVLIRKNQDSLDDFERNFLDIAFGNKLECPVDRLFEEFEINDSLYKGAEKKDEDEIRAQGRRMQYRIDAAVDSVAQDVQKKIRSFGLPSYYRPLAPKEEATGRKVMIFGFLAWFVALLAVLASFVFHHFSIYYLVATLTLWIFPVVFRNDYKRAERDGVVNALGAEQRYYWDSFGRMLKEIAHLDDAELQSLVLWNRLLVYAALFGVADKVTKVMKLRQIHLVNPTLDAFVYTPLYNDLIHSSQAMTAYGSTASSASNFTVSSGGSGGFSGGGGGGGFGAF